MAIAPTVRPVLNHVGRYEDISSFALGFIVCGYMASVLPCTEINYPSYHPIETLNAPDVCSGWYGGSMWQKGRTI